MLLKLVSLLSIICIIYANQEECVSYKDCLKNKDEAKKTAEQNQDKLDKELDNVKNSIIDDYKKAIDKFNKEVLKNIYECSDFGLNQDSKHYADIVMKWCTVRAVHCRKNNAKTYKPHKYTEEKGDEKFCSNFTEVINEECNETKFKIKTFKHCPYKQYFKGLYVVPWYRCLKEYDDEHKNKYFKCNPFNEYDRHCGDNKNKHKKDHKGKNYDDDEDDYPRKHKNEKGNRDNDRDGHNKGKDKDGGLSISLELDIF